MATSRDVAKLAGVSIATISRVYRSPESVRDITRDKVLKAAEELNYYPNLLARSLKENKSNSIGISVNDFKNPFFFQVIEQIQFVLEKTDYQLLTFSPSGNYFSNDKIIRYLRSNQLDAFLFSPFFYNKEDHRLFQNCKQYCLQLYTDYYEDIDSIIIDDKYGTYLAAKYLLECGHRKILIINAAIDGKDVRDDGYIQAYRDISLIPDSRYILHYPCNQNHVQSIKESISQLRPTAIISHAEALTIWTLSALQELGMTVPDNISLIAYDDHPWAEIMGITAVAQPIRLVGKIIADTILDALSSGGPRPIVKKKIKPELIKRNSVMTL